MYGYYQYRCHWCNTQLLGKQERFCSDACKAAHFRAYRSWVTAKKRYGRNGNASKGRSRKK